MRAAGTTSARPRRSSGPRSSTWVGRPAPASRRAPSWRVATASTCPSRTNTAALTSSACTGGALASLSGSSRAVSYTHLRAHETSAHL
eukprot:9172419-Alexandrium_andersonii.AAC.1